MININTYISGPKSINLDTLEDVNGFTQATSDQVYGLKRKGPGLPYEPSIVGGSEIIVDPTGGIVDSTEGLRILIDPQSINLNTLRLSANGLTATTAPTLYHWALNGTSQGDPNDPYPFSTGDSERFSKVSYVSTSDYLIHSIGIVSVLSSGAGTNEAVTVAVVLDSLATDVVITKPAGSDINFIVLSEPYLLSKFTTVGLKLLSPINNAIYTGVDLYVIPYVSPIPENVNVNLDMSEDSLSIAQTFSRPKFKGETQEHYNSEVVLASSVSEEAQTEEAQTEEAQTEEALPQEALPKSEPELPPQIQISTQTVNVVEETNVNPMMMPPMLRQAQPTAPPVRFIRRERDVLENVYPDIHRILSSQKRHRN